MNKSERQLIIRDTFISAIISTIELLRKESNKFTIGAANKACLEALYETNCDFINMIIKEDKFIDSDELEIVLSKNEFSLGDIEEVMHMYVDKKSSKKELTDLLKEIIQLLKEDK